MNKNFTASIDTLADFGCLIDARTPLEFNADHIPGALNLPVLSNAERIIVGTLHKQYSVFEAKRTGAAFVAANIAHHLETSLKNHPRDFQPLVYCWRGGLRSAAFVTWLRMIGWDARQLKGGYKAFRHEVIAALDSLPQKLHFRVLCGPTGSAKTLILAHLRREGAQVLDLESIAAHKGSVLGALPHRRQPTQKGFETALWHALKQFNPAEPIYVEAESRKIGTCHIPEILIEQIRQSPCIEIQAPLEARLNYLVEEYAYLGQDLPTLHTNLEKLSPLHAKETLQHWHQSADAGNWPALFESLLTTHYDPLYRRSQGRNFAHFSQAIPLQIPSLNPQELEMLSKEILRLPS